MNAQPHRHAQQEDDAPETQSTGWFVLALSVLLLTAGAVVTGLLPRCSLS